MRGVYSAGAIAPLVSEGFTAAFDHVIGSSAGAINGAYFLAADPQAMLTYTDDITNKNFINFRRKEKKIDIDYLVDMVLKHKRPIDIKLLGHSPTRLHIVMTDARNGQKVVISDHRKFEKIYDEFRATAALPMLYNQRVPLDGRWYIDGGVSDLLPVDVAIKLGCTDIVVVMTQRLENYHFDARHSRLVRRIVKHLARSQPKSIQAKLPTDARLLQANLRRITHPSKRLRFYVLEPSDTDAIIGLATTDKIKVERLARLGVDDMTEFLHTPVRLYGKQY